MIYLIIFILILYFIGCPFVQGIAKFIRQNFSEVFGLKSRAYEDEKSDNVEEKDVPKSTKGNWNDRRKNNGIK